MDQDATWYGGRPRLRPHCVRWGPISPEKAPRKGAPPIFGSCLLWPNGRLSQQLLSCCYFVLSVPVLLIAWKDRPRNDLLYVSFKKGVKHLLTHSRVHGVTRLCAGYYILPFLVLLGTHILRMKGDAVANGCQ